MNIIPPNISKETEELIRQGSWSCVKDGDGYIIYTEPYSPCCNPSGQTKYYLDKDGTVLRYEVVDNTRCKTHGL